MSVPPNVYTADLDRELSELKEKLRSSVIN